MVCYPWGGSEELWAGSAMELLKSGYRVVANVKYWPKPARQLSALRESGCELRMRQPAGRIWWHLNRLSRGLIPRPLDSRWLDEVRPDLVVLSLGIHQDGADWMLACARRKIPYTVLVQAASENIWPSDEGIKALREGYQGAARVFFVAVGNRDVVETQIGCSLSQSELIFNPFGVPYDSDPTWPNEQTGYRLACVGRLDPSSKGQDLLFKVLRQPKWRERDVSVALFGQGSNGDALRVLRDHYQLSNVSLGGFKNGVLGIWEDHHALVLPSRHEGLPIAVVEAMLCQRPCIVTDVAGNAEAVQDGLSGFVAEAPTVRALDDAMERGWRRRHEWKEMGAEAGRRIRSLVPRDPAAVFASRLKALVVEEQQPTNEIGIRDSDNRVVGSKSAYV